MEGRYQEFIKVDWHVDVDVPVPADCSLTEEICNKRPTDPEILDDDLNVTKSVISCQSPPQPKICSSFSTRVEVTTSTEPLMLGGNLAVVPEGSAIHYDTRNCSTLISREQYDVTRTQKNGTNLLDEMRDFYSNSSECNRISNEVFSRAYGAGCGFDSESS